MQVRNRSEIFTQTAVGGIAVVVAVNFALHEVFHAWILSGLVAGILLIKLAYTGKKILAIVLAAFLLRMGLASLQEYHQVLPYPWDEKFYHELSSIAASNAAVINPELADMSIKELQDRLGYNDQGIHIELARRSYSEMMERLFSGDSFLKQLEVLRAANTNFYYGFISGKFYFLLGSNTFTMRAVNAIIGAGVVYCIYLIIRLVFYGRRIAEITAIIGAFSPSSIVFTALHMRDAFICLVFISSCYFFLKWMRYPKWQTAGAWALLCVVMSLLRPINVVIFLVVGIPAASFFLYNKLKREFLGRSMFRLVALCVLIFSAWSAERIEISEKDPFLARLELEREWRANGGSAYLTGQSYRSWADVLSAIPLRFLHFSFGPFPWEVSNLFQILGSLEGLFFLLCFVKALQSLYSMRGQSDGGVVILCFLGFTIVGLSINALIDSNYGTAIRHRMVYVYALIPFAFDHVYRRVHQTTSEAS